VRAVAAQELPGDGHAGFAQFGDARLEQRLRVGEILEVGSVLAGKHVRLDDVHDMDRCAARQRRGERAHLA
jgi:hypothetical protein